jgi:hypothetical protein
MKTLVRTLVILLAALAVAGVVWGVAQSPIGEAMRVKMESRIASRAPDAPPPNALDGGFDPAAMGGDFDEGAPNRGLYLGNTVENITIMGGIAALVVAIGLVSGGIKKARRVRRARSTP